MTDITVHIVQWKQMINVTGKNAIVLQEMFLTDFLFILGEIKPICIRDDNFLYSFGFERFVFLCVYSVMKCYVKIKIDTAYRNTTMEVSLTPDSKAIVWRFF